MKPDVSAPGVSVLSSIPAREGSWAEWSGTSMASPHVAGAAALLKQRHRSWTVAQIKSALVLTGTPVFTSTNRTSEVPSSREGGGLINLARGRPAHLLSADGPLVRAPAPGLSAEPDADPDGRGWRSGTVAGRRRPAAGPGRHRQGCRIGSGTRQHQVAAGATSAQNSEVTGFIVLTKGSDTGAESRSGRTSRRRGFRGRSIARSRRRARTPGTHEDTRPWSTATATPRIRPESVFQPSSTAPEQVFTVRLSRLVANFGVAILKEGKGVSIQPRVVADNDENRLTGYPALPFNLNPYVTDFYKLTPVSGAILPAKAGTTSSSTPRAASTRASSRSASGSTT